MKRAITRKDRRLDSLARLLKGSSACAAVCFDGERFLIASNILTPKPSSVDTINYKLIFNVMAYFAGIAKNGLSELPKSDERLKLFHNVCNLYVQSELQKAYQASFNQYLERLTSMVLDLDNPMDIRKKSIIDLTDIIKVNPKQVDSRIGSFLGGAQIIISRLALDFKKLEKELSEKHEVLFDPLLEAFKNSDVFLNLSSDRGEKYKQFLRKVVDGNTVSLNEQAEHGYELIRMEVQAERILMQKCKFHKDWWIKE